MIRSLVAGATLCLLVACGSPAGQEAAAPPALSSASQTPVAMPPVAPVVGNPTSLSIPAIGVTSSLVSLGLTATNEHEVPPVETPEQAGWYEPGPEPGQVGPAIILGHVNGGGKPGVFAHLDDLKPGDEITVDAQVFRVTEVERADKDAFPADRVYAETVEPELRVITCGGAFDHASGNYVDNVIVYAVMVGGR